MSKLQSSIIPDPVQPVVPVWTWAIQSITPNPDGTSFTLNYSVTDGTKVIARPPSLISATPPDDIKTACIRTCDNDIAYMNKIEAQKAAVASTDVSVLVGTADAVKAVIASEQVQVQVDQTAVQAAADQQAFVQMLSDYRNAVAGENLGVPVPIASPILLAQIQKAFKPEYLVMLGGRGF